MQARWRFVLLSIAMLALAGGPAWGQTEAEDDSTDEGMTAAEFYATLNPQTGTIQLADDLATVDVPEGFRFLSPEDSYKLIVYAWGNPPGAAAGVLGMLVPVSPTPVDSLGWGIVIEFSDEGYVDDKDAGKIDYKKLLEEMQKATVESNKIRAQGGFPEVTLVGWAAPPRYDHDTHKLYWAKELAFGDMPHTLNYSIRILGRRGILQLNAVAAMSQLDEIERESIALLPSVNFNAGHRYADYVHGSDKRAAYGIAGVILGGVAMKAGLLKGLLLAILAFKKFAIVGVVALFGVIRQVITGRRTKTAPPPPAPPPASPVA